MRIDDDFARHFPPLGRHAYLEPWAVQKLVLAVKPGFYVPATLEKYRDCWRLRVTLRGVSGETIRRGITISDRATAEWVADYIKRARLDRKQCRKDASYAG